MSSPMIVPGPVLDQAVLDLLRGPLHRGKPGGLPTSIRFLFYELETMGLLSKDGRPSTLSESLMRLRESGEIPWEWIEDETRSLDSWAFAPTVHQYVLDRIDEARIDCWDGEPPPMIITESRSLAGVLRGIAARYLCPIAATNGQVGGFLHTDVIPALDEGQRVIYLGDEDLAGHHIEANTRRVIEAETGELEWERLALTPDQVREYGLTAVPKYDKRTKTHGVAYETEALGQTRIQQMLVDRLDDLLAEPLDDVKVRERQQREGIYRLVKKASA